MTLNPTLSTILIYLTFLPIAYCLWRKKEFFVSYHFFNLSFLIHDSSLALANLFSKVSLFVGLAILFFQNKGEFLQRQDRKLWKGGVFTCALYFTSCIVVPLLHGYFFGTNIEIDLRNFLVPLWALIAYFLVDPKSFKIDSFFGSFKGFSLITMLCSLPATLVFFWDKSLSFHRIRTGEFHLIESISNFYIFLNPGGKIPKIWFLVDALWNHLFLVSFLVYLCCVLEKSWKTRDYWLVLRKLWWSFPLLVLWNYSTIWLTLILFLAAMAVVFLFVIVGSQKDRLKMVLHGILLPALLFVSFAYAVNQFNHKKFRYNAIQYKVSVNKHELVPYGEKYFTYKLTGEETLNNFSRVEKWYLQYVNLMNLGPMKGIGYPVDRAQDEHWKDDIGLLSGHSKFFDDLMRLGVFSGLFINAIFILPILLLLILLLRGCVKERFIWQWIKWFTLFVGVFINGVFGIWGEITLAVGLQLFMFLLLLYWIQELRQSKECAES